MNKNDTRASVAMAVYNGEKYLKCQIESIKSMMSDKDELVISYDTSSDDTLKIINGYAMADKRIKVFKNVMSKGVSGNFTNAALHTNGKYILFSDQDDIWFGNKIEEMIECMQLNNADLVIHDGYFTDQNLVIKGKSIFENKNPTTNPIINFIQGRFLGCCTCIKREMLFYLLPFPDITNDFPHDIYMEIVCAIKGKVVTLNKPMIYHRIHERNATPKKRNSLPKIVFSRMLLFYEISKTLFRNKLYLKGA